jgi:hypothetical protein
MSKQPVISWAFLRIVCAAGIGLLGFIPASAQVQRPPRQPAENPPTYQLPDHPESTPILKVGPASESPTTEWVWHKTTDNLHPSDQEQLMVWLTNRARSNPHAEGVWLATSSDPDIAGGREYFNVNETLMQTQFDSYSAKPPAAFDRRLYLAAKDHSDYMISIDTQTHNGQSGRIATYNFTCSAWSGIVFAYADNALNAHAAFNIDWGNTPTGMQDPPGHRLAIMAVNTLYSNIGYALVYENDPNTDVGPYVTTGNLCIARTGASYPDQYNQFIVGTVWRDLDWDGMYDPGEGIGGVTVTPNTGSYFAITANSGGYAIPVTGTAGDYATVNFVGGGINDNKDVTVGSVSVLLDYIFAPDFTDFVYLPVVRK